MKKYIELTAEERAEVNRRITAVIGTSADIDKIEDTTDRMIARSEWRKLFDKIVKLYDKYGEKGIAMTYMQSGGGYAEGITASGQKWRYYPNQYGLTRRSWHCGTLYIEKKCIFTSGTIAKALEYAINK